MDRADDESCEQRPAGLMHRRGGGGITLDVRNNHGWLRAGDWTPPPPPPPVSPHLSAERSLLLRRAAFFFFFPASSTLSWKNTDEEQTTRFPAAALLEVLARSPGPPPERTAPEQYQPTFATAQRGRQSERDAADCSTIPRLRNTMMDTQTTGTRS